MVHGKTDIMMNRGNKMVRIDHSEMYFENDRLSEELVTEVDTIHRFKHRQFITRALEIGELRKTITALQAMTKASHIPNKLLPHRTSPRYTYSKPSSAFSSVVRINVQVPKESSNKFEIDSDSDSDSDYAYASSDEDTFISGKAETKSKALSKLEQARKFLGRRNIPSDWYTKVLAPRDVLVKRPTSAMPKVRPTTRAGPKIRAKSAPSVYTNSRAMPTTERTTLIHLKNVSDKKGDGPEKGSKLAGNQRRAISASLSRRQLMELSHQRCEKMERKNMINFRLEESKERSERLQARVDLFLRSIDEFTLNGHQQIEPVTFY